MTRQRTTETPQPGMQAMYATECAACGGDIRQGDRISYRRGEYIHVGCATGGDDE